MSRKDFGTDGIRGRVGQFPINPEFCLRLGWAVGTVFAKKGPAHILIGKDTRISGYMFEAALEAGVTAAGVDINLLGPMPTPSERVIVEIFGGWIAVCSNTFEIGLSHAYLAGEFKTHQYGWYGRLHQ